MRLNSEVCKICMDYRYNRLYEIELKGDSISPRTLYNIANGCNCSVATETKVAYLLHIPVEEVIDFKSVIIDKNVKLTNMIIDLHIIKELKTVFGISVRTIERYVADMEGYSERYGAELIVSGASKVSTMALLDYYINRYALSDSILYSNIILPYDGMRLYEKIINEKHN